VTDATTGVAARPGVLARSWQASRAIDPRYLIAGLITLVLLVAQFRYHLVGGYERLLLALAVCTGTEAVLSWFDRGKVVNLQSAYISGISLTLLTKPQGAAIWPFVIGGFLAISSKYVIKYRENHLFNPTNFAICTLLLLAPDKVSVLSHQFGNDLATNLVIWFFGLIIATRVGVAHVTLSYLVSFLLLTGMRAAALGQPLLPEIAPITGPMYQLFLFFMITDPRTVVRGRKKQIIVTVIIAVVDSLIRLMSDMGVPMPTAFNAAPPLLALWIVGPIAKYFDLRYGNRSASVPRPATTVAAA
jgi:Na+-translocating ferredoxin:NAD+ oxidoreductase RnfD subunit